MAEYIEREALLVAYDEAHKGPPGGARKLIEKAPAEKVVPVRRGKWQQLGTNFIGPVLRCTICIHLYNVASGEGNKNFCPNCGADMRECEGGWDA